MIVEKENIAGVFYIFHDGEIVFEKEENSNQIWRIDCKYLAEMINQKFDFFWIKIHECKCLQFNPWMNPISLPKETWIGVKEIFKTGLEISSAKVNEKQIEISCNQHDLDFNFCGGELFLDCKGIEVFDEEWNEISAGYLEEICNKYWNK